VFLILFQPVLWGCVAGMSRFTIFIFLNKKNSREFCFKKWFLDFSDFVHFTARFIWQVICALFALFFCCFCCAFCCSFAWNIIYWVWGKFSSCFVRFSILFWQITVAKFLEQFSVAKLLVLVFSFARVLRYFFSALAFA